MYAKRCERNERVEISRGERKRASEHGSRLRNPPTRSRSASPKSQGSCQGCGKGRWNVWCRNARDMFPVKPSISANRLELLGRALFNFLIFNSLEFFNQSDINTRAQCIHSRKTNGYTRRQKRFDTSSSRSIPCLYRVFLTSILGLFLSGSKPEVHISTKKRLGNFPNISRKPWHLQNHLSSRFASVRIVRLSQQG